MRAEGTLSLSYSTCSLQFLQVSTVFQPAPPLPRLPGYPRPPPSGTSFNLFDLSLPRVGDLASPFPTVFHKVFLLVLFLVSHSYCRKASSCPQTSFFFFLKCE